MHTLTDLLPPPLDDTQEALRTRDHAAIPKVAALPPVNADEADRKREATDGTATEDAPALHVAQRSMLRVVDPDAGPPEMTWPEAVPVEAPAAYVDQRIENAYH